MKRSIPTVLSLLILFAYLFSNYGKQTPKSEFDLDLLGETPVVLNGRVQPLDSVARNTLLAMNGKRTAYYQDGSRHPAIEWLAELMFDPAAAEPRPVFRVYDDGLRSLLPHKEPKQRDSAIAAAILGAGSSHHYFSFAEIRSVYERIRQDAAEASEIESDLRNRYQQAVIELANNAIRYHGLRMSIHHGETPSFVEELEVLQRVMPAGLEAMNQRAMGQDFDESAFNTMLSFGATYQRFDAESLFFTHPRPQKDGEEDWDKAASLLSEISRDGAPSEITLQWATIVDAYREGQPEVFNQAVAALHAAIAEIAPDAIDTASVEQQFNYLEPFYVSMVGYVLVLLLVLFSWIFAPAALNQAAYWTAFVTFILHTIGILFRIYIIGYAPVINLYSSAIFVGWGAVLLALILERINKNGIGNFVAALVGFATLIVAHHLGSDGDTLEMMRAVLDSNFWLATHVIIITLGYAATYLAGAIGVVYVLMGLLTNRIDAKTQKSLQSMVYGIVCFALLFSFVGTILGGIWADQSWGRFWGWDPKENGAILLVLWNIIILHARWGGFAKTRGIMAMAIFGNIVTSWSWMGTNMLGIGLHSYGFMSEAFNYLAGFMISQLVIIALAYIPTRFWRSPVKV